MNLTVFNYFIDIDLLDFCLKHLFLNLRREKMSENVEYVYDLHLSRDIYFKINFYIF